MATEQKEKSSLELMNKESYTKQEFDYVLKHVVPIDQRKEWAQANKHKIKPEIDPIVEKAKQWHLDFMEKHAMIPGTKHAYKAGWEANPAKYTEQDMINALIAGGFFTGSAEAWIQDYNHENNIK